MTTSLRGAVAQNLVAELARQAVTAAGFAPL